MHKGYTLCFLVYVFLGTFGLIRVNTDCIQIYNFIIIVLVCNFLFKYQQILYIGFPYFLYSWLMLWCEWTCYGVLFKCPTTWVVTYFCFLAIMLIRHLILVLGCTCELDSFTGVLLWWLIRNQLKSASFDLWFWVSSTKSLCQSSVVIELV